MEDIKFTNDHKLKWKHLFFSCLTAFLFLFIVSCKNHTDPEKTYSKFFVVKHAERYPGFNGHLTWYGRERAGDLMRLLKDSGIQKIYVTPYSRTLETADSLRLLQTTDTVVYLTDSTGQNLSVCLEQHRDYGKTILIVGHGNTVPGILRRLGASYQGDEIPDSIFNEIFEVINNHGKVSMGTFRYGKPNLPDTFKMKNLNM
ncbi:MAG: histidine phosphatase family protein [Chitinophagaceae bacterium]|nr:MAG: histidine phosphatase family protein [Chitinophagaceae bacterium]